MSHSIVWKSLSNTRPFFCSSIFCTRSVLKKRHCETSKAYVVQINGRSIFIDALLTVLNSNLNPILKIAR